MFEMGLAASLSSDLHRIHSSGSRCQNRRSRRVRKGRTAKRFVICEEVDRLRLIKLKAGTYFANGETLPKIDLLLD